MKSRACGTHGMLRTAAVLGFAALAAAACGEETFGFSNGLYQDAPPSAMIRVPAGAFTMGSDEYPGIDLFREPDEGFSDERPEHRVFVSEFRIDATEVTNAQYRTCVSDDACADPWQSDSRTRPEYYLDPAYDEFPVIHVSHVQAERYCRWRGLRLPTEAEWERAARGNGERIYPWGDRTPDCARANFSNVASERTPSGDIVFHETCFGDTLSVNAYANSRSPYGLFNMAGNAAEWVADWYAPDYYDDAKFEENNEDPVGPAEGSRRVIRGGSFADTSFFIRTAARSHAAPDSHFAHVGFRCAQSSD